MLGWVLDALASCEADDGVDVQTLVGNDASGCLNLLGFQLATHHHEDIAVLALMAHPVLVFFIGDRGKADVYAQFGSLEQQFFHHLSRVLFFHANKDAQRQGGVDIGLTDI